MQRLVQQGGAAQAAYSVPDAFLWGATLSAHGHEGGDDGSDWTHWEQRPGRIAGNADALSGVDHWNRFAQDFELAAQLGMNALQISISWSRIAPTEDGFDDAALAHYAQVFHALRARGLQALCVLHEHAVPAWFARRGGWCWRGAPAAFEAYARRVAETLGPVCRYWMPFYEPEHWVTMAFRERAWPGAAGVFSSERAAVRNLLAAHRFAYAALRAHGAQHRVGFSVRGTRCAPFDLESPWDLKRARREHQRRNHRMLREVTRQGCADFIGLSYYGKESIRFNPWNSPPIQVVGRAFRASVPHLPPAAKPDAPGLAALLAEFGTYTLPILITGNGLASNHDKERCDFLLDHLHFVVYSLQNGIEVQGYFHWSLLDGFAWRAGYAARSGLVHVDQESLVRTPNASAFLYRDLCRARALAGGAISRHRPHWTPPEKEHV